MKVAWEQLVPHESGDTVISLPGLVEGWASLPQISTVGSATAMQHQSFWEGMCHGFFLIPQEMRQDNL
jgi:hypothetical protein